MDMSTRYAEIQEKGLTALASADIKPFLGVGNSFKQRLIFASCWSVPDTVLKLLDDLTWLESLDFCFIIAGLDYPLHATLKQATAPEGVVWPNEIVRDSLGLPAPASFDTLILDGGNLLLAASNVPDQLVAMRASLDQELVRLGLEPLPLPILHITLARMVEVPESEQGRRAAFTVYQKVVLPWRLKLAKEPVVLDLEANVRMASVYDLLEGPF